MSSTYGAERFTLVLDSGTVYFQGNGPALQDQLGVPAANTAGLAGKWISVTSSDGPYSIIAPGITVSDQVQETTLVPASSTTTGGIIRIIGTASAPQNGGGNAGSAHLDIAATSHLPALYVASTSANGTTTSSSVTFSRWGTAPTVSAPTGATAWSTLGASEPPGGYGSGGNSTPATPAA